ncbi:unnamed protein product [Pleuronectes platessa]|uniref:Uncharacterized protein n=1 Tax=Pleuronectes platessa TaxID=8262 RepID=A0A9N7YKH7_PLEPL|nr:unnamed protein product [Pleuronectes platessa]
MHTNPVLAFPLHAPLQGADVQWVGAACETASRAHFTLWHRAPTRTPGPYLLVSDLSGSPLLLSPQGEVAIATDSQTYGGERRRRAGLKGRGCRGEVEGGGVRVGGGGAEDGYRFWDDGALSFRLVLVFHLSVGQPCGSPPPPPTPPHLISRLCHMTRALSTLGQKRGSVWAQKLKGQLSTIGTSHQTIQFQRGTRGSCSQCDGWNGIRLSPGETEETDRDVAGLNEGADCDP